ncbi:hypothetical protein KC318_g8399 [Hortaea werneckii]|nr:hypothetical protein KC334_g8560 [Hortaea werneckii]KAI7004972.1 hypothetical protein KC355_g8444 [Hortaea werneckii]KAI7663283.1 hypothetical protein KC318_g8399 [Hortaea werneckii]
MNTAESAQDTTSNDVGNGREAAEHFLRQLWEKLQTSTKAAKMYSYVGTVFEAQAKVYEKAAKESRVEMRSAYQERGDALGVLADAIKQSPVLPVNMSSNEMLEALMQAEPVQKILDKAASYVAAAQKEHDEDQVERLFAGLGIEGSSVAETASSNGETELD